VLSFFGISLPVVQVGGGLIVIASGWALLRQEDAQERSTVERRTVDCNDVLHQAFYPLTLPLTVGPGSISVALTLGANEPHSLGASVLSIVAAAIGSALVAATIYICYAYADRLASVLGPTGTNVIVKLTSFLLVCIGVQIVWNGVSQLLRSVL
jgi:multiple antibiotic resistance protein